jgi:16S rRNA processing protein RimM
MKFIKIGKICGTHGLYGVLKVDFFYDIKDLYNTYKFLLISNDRVVFSLRVENYSVTNGIYLFKLSNINDIKKAKEYMGFEIILPISLKKYIKELKREDEFERLIGYRVFDELNQYLGELCEYYNFNGNIVFKIISGNKYYLISNNKEHILEINTTNSQLTVLRLGLVEHNF